MSSSSGRAGRRFEEELGAPFALSSRLLPLLLLLLEAAPNEELLVLTFLSLPWEGILLFFGFVIVFLLAFVLLLLLLLLSEASRCYGERESVCVSVEV